MNLLPRAAEKSMKRQCTPGKLFLLGTAVILFVVLGPGVGKSISKQQDPGSCQVATFVKAVKMPTNRSNQVDIRYKQMKERAEHRQLATLLRDGKATIDPAKRKKLAILLLLTGGQAHNIRL